MFVMLDIQYVKVGDINDKAYIYIYDIKYHDISCMPSYVQYPQFNESLSGKSC